MTMTTTKTYYSTTEVSDITGAPVWAVRRTVDSMDLSIMRIGLQRAIAAEYLAEIRAELIRRGYIQNEEG